MFEYDGQQYTQAQVEDAAKKRDMTLSDYVSKFGIKQIVEQESPGKQKPTAEGAAVEKQEAPKSTESNSANTSYRFFTKTPVSLQINSLASFP